MVYGLCYLLILIVFHVTFGWFPSSYPEYCMKPPLTRKIPPLSANDQLKVESLEQVQVIVRHGSRTPYMKYQCWKDYSVPWKNCNVTEIMVPSPSSSSRSLPSQWLFRKVYDGSPDELGGNCFTGQLISEGYEQELQNGRYLFDAYLNPKLLPTHLRLFPSNHWSDLDSETEIYLRSDDEQRTLMSGQLVINGMFNVSVATSTDNLPS
jgi:hypothetical protein